MPYPQGWPMIVATLLPHWRVQDIDTPDDWRRAEAMVAAMERGAG